MDKQNIKNGPMTQVMIKEIRINFGLAKIFGICENLTLVKGGYIIKIKPMANGMLVLPFE